MLAFNLLCVSFSMMVAVCAYRDRFINVKCVKLLNAWKLVGKFDALQPALKSCIKSIAKCSGVRKVSENDYKLIFDVYGYEVTQEWQGDYIFDFTNGTKHPKSPLSVATYVLYATYRNASCPMGNKIFGNKCRFEPISASYTGNDSPCQGHPAYMNVTYDPVTQYCYAATKEQIIQSWT
uniref:Secreted protein n=1 Tax=Panagrolaimus sp. ES5 TaxID=591445 RepID=A0AC34F4F1_9BILA